MANAYPTIIPGLRSPFDQVKGLVYFGRMLDKIRLAAAGRLPEGWQAMRGTAMKNSLDSRCCNFLKIDYAAIEKETLKGGSDEELLAWAFANGRQPTGEEIEVWNAFMTKRGWHDAGTQRLNERLAEIGLPPGTVQTMFEFIDLDEGRLNTGRIEHAMKPIDGYVLIKPDDLQWRPSSMMRIPNADFLERTKSEIMAARLWRLPPGSANTLHKHVRAEEFFFVLEGVGRLRVGEQSLTVPKHGGVLVGPGELRQIFNDTETDALWLIVSAPEEMDLVSGPKPDMSRFYPVDPKQLPKELAGVEWPPRR